MVGRLRYRPIQTMNRGTDLPLLSNLNRSRSHGFTNLKGQEMTFEDFSLKVGQMLLRLNNRLLEWLNQFLSRFRSQ